MVGTCRATWLDQGNRLNHENRHSSDRRRGRAAQNLSRRQRRFGLHRPSLQFRKNYGNNIDWKQWREYEEFTRSWLKETKRILQPTGSLYVFMGIRFISQLFLILQEMDFHLNGWITWHYTQGMGRVKGFSPRHEDILYFTKSDKYTFNLGRHSNSSEVLQEAKQHEGCKSRRCLAVLPSSLFKP